ncbi:MAG TPA: ferrous iron transport protein B [Acidobacteriota bacterium]|nr:ferrous iron transport protein B [Acidobacteriota bacterium]
MNVRPDSAVSPRDVAVAICGNPNSGKTTIFNAITGLRQKVGNYPGVTVERVSGRFGIRSCPESRFTLVDVPGAYSLAAFSPDEYIAAGVLFGHVKDERSPDVIVYVLDATNLERGLYMLFQILQLGRPVVVALNMMDVAWRCGLRIEAAVLSERLGGVPVVPVVGSRNRGIDDLKRAIGRTLTEETGPGQQWYDARVMNVVETLKSASNNGRRSDAEYLRVLFDVAGPAEGSFLRQEEQAGRAVLAGGRQRLIDSFGSLSAAETLPLTASAAEVAAQAVIAPKTGRDSITERLDRVLLHRLLGPVILVALMILMFQSVFSWAEPAMTTIDRLFSGFAGQVESVMAAGPLRSLLADGIIGGAGSVLVFLPQIVILFFFIALLEDSGYLPRAAFLVDRMFSWCGLSGKSFIPMLSSFACAIPGIMATRTIESRKLRLITILVSPLMSCSARLPVYAIMIAAFIPHRSYWGLFNSRGLVLTGLYLLGISVAVLVSLVLSKTLLPSRRGTFMLEMPSYKLPTPRSIYIRVYARARSFVVRAGTLILAITIIIWALSYYPRPPDLQQPFEFRQAALGQEYNARIADIQGRLSSLENRSPQTPSVRVEQVRQSLASTSSLEELDRTAGELYRSDGASLDFVRLLVERRETDLTFTQARQAIGAEQAGANLRNSYFGRIGRTVEPVFRPLGWDWKVTMATLASFPAREVIIATLGTIFNLGEGLGEGSPSLVARLRRATWDDGPKKGQPLFTVAVALSITIFFALCCQCGATLVTIRQETNSWWYPVATFAYMSTLAYLCALAAYQLIVRLA